MRAPGGELTIFRDDGKVVTHETFTCRHCQRIVVVPTRGDPADSGGFCGICRSLICGPCADAGKCSPFEDRLAAEERAAERARMWRALGVG